MSNKNLKRKLLIRKLFRKLFNKRRLVILNEETFEETFSLKLTLMNVFVVGTIGAILIITFTIYIIAFTTLREYIPGYASTTLKKEAFNLAIKSDSLEKAVKRNNIYISSIKKALTGNTENIKWDKDSLVSLEKKEIEFSKLEPSENEIKLREQVQEENKYNVFESAKPKVNFVLFAPVQGSIIEKYNVKKKHLAVKIAVLNNTPIKAIANGTIVFADWTPSSGYVIIIRHQEGILSVYKNAAFLTKDQGNTIRSGEVIALAGNSTTNNSGVNLHFELWKDGFPIDPTQFINFE
uniref:murein hydrolase activator EnvC family protein n=1 Tax=Flavobacterium sp. TaxID=239 RepID=UPI0040490C70